MNTPTASSLFESEAAEIPALLARQAARLPQRLEQLVARLDRMAPTLLATIARGSSDNAAAFAGYVAALKLGLPAASLPPSIASLYGRTLRLEGAVTLVISQSGASPDLALAARHARSGGAITVGLINEPDSALAREIEFEVRIDAGTERAIAATKTFMLTATATLHLVALWSRDERLRSALNQLPRVLEGCRTLNWQRALDTLGGHDRAFVVARGAALPVAAELALKLKEIPGLLADAQSAAGFLHGPATLASPGMPAVVLAGDPTTRESVCEAISVLQAAGAPVVLLSAQADAPEGTHVARVPDAGHELLQPLVSLFAMYPALAQLARLRHRDPDRPPHLQKLTRTR